MSQQVLINRII